MAQNFKHTRTVSDTIRVKGILSDDGKSITYTKDKEDVTADLFDLIKQYAGEYITFGLTTKEELDLEE